MEHSSTSSSDPRQSPGFGGFLARFLLFLVGGGLLLTPLCIVSLRADRSALASRAFRMGPETRLVVAGDSHTETSINPALVPGTVNISKSAENYFYTYFKLKHFLDCSPQVKTVVLGFSPHNVMDHDQQFYEDKANRWKDYFVILDSRARRELASFRLPYVVAYLKAEYGIPFRLFQNPVAMKYLLGRDNFSRVDFPFNGGYKSLNGSFLDAGKISRRARDHFLKEEKYSGTSSVMVDYLYKIADLCGKRGGTLILLDTPVSDSYRKLIPGQALADYREIRDDLIRKHPQVKYLDLSTMNLSPKDYFDGNHVNREGAKVVTTNLSNSFAGILHDCKP